LFLIMSRHPKTNITLSSHHGSIPAERESRSFMQSKSEYNNLGDKVIKLCSATKSGDNEGDKLSPTGDNCRNNGANDQLLALEWPFGTTKNRKRSEYDLDMLAYCHKHNLWDGFARIRDVHITREDTYNKVLNMLIPLITKDSRRTKGNLMRYVRDNFEGPSAYADVGKVANKVIKQQTGYRSGKWERATSNRFIRLRK
tara:strand:- start:771 stop:1367 length:597 start_codon:yes stop_codon:yes gene_type:complete